MGVLGVAVWVEPVHLKADLAHMRVFFVHVSAVHACVVGRQVCGMGWVAWADKLQTGCSIVTHSHLYVPLWYVFWAYFLSTIRLQTIQMSSCSSPAACTAKQWFCSQPVHGILRHVRNAGYVLLGQRVCWLCFPARVHCLLW